MNVQFTIIFDSQELFYCSIESLLKKLLYLKSNLQFEFVFVLRQ